MISALVLPSASRRVYVCLRRLVPAQADYDDSVQGGVGLTVTAPVESVALDLAGGGWDGVRAAERGEGGFGAQPVRVVAGCDEESRSTVWADTKHLEQRG